MTNGHRSEKSFPGRLDLIGDDTRVVLTGLLRLIVEGSTDGIFPRSISNCLIEEWDFSKQGAENVMRALRELKFVEKARGGPKPQYRLMFGTDMDPEEVVDKSLAAWAAAQETSEADAPEDGAPADDASPAVSSHRLVELYRRRDELQEYRDNRAAQLAEADAQLALVNGAIRGIDMVLASMPVSKELARCMDEFDQMLEEQA